MMAFLLRAGAEVLRQDGLLESINLSIAVELRCDARCVAGTAVNMLSSPPSLAFCYQVCVLPGVRDG